MGKNTIHDPTLLVVHADRTGPGKALTQSLSDPVKTTTAAYTVAIRLYRSRIRLVYTLYTPFSELLASHPDLNGNPY
jgi:hypothetical protein